MFQKSPKGFLFYIMGPQGYTLAPLGAARPQTRRQIVLPVLANFVFFGLNDFCKTEFALLRALNSEGPGPLRMTHRAPCSFCSLPSCPCQGGPREKLSGLWAIAHLHNTSRHRHPVTIQKRKRRWKFGGKTQSFEEKILNILETASDPQIH